MTDAHKTPLRALGRPGSSEISFTVGPITDLTGRAWVLKAICSRLHVIEEVTPGRCETKIYPVQTTFETIPEGFPAFLLKDGFIVSRPSGSELVRLPAGTIPDPEEFVRGLGS